MYTHVNRLTETFHMRVVEPVLYVKDLDRCGSIDYLNIAIRTSNRV